MTGTHTNPQPTTHDSNAERLQLGDWVLCVRTNCLQRGDERVDLEHRLVALLAYLARNPGRLLGKEELLKNLWAGRVVNDDSLAVAISQLRKALGDNARSPRFIKTIPGRGYVWVGDARIIQPVDNQEKSPGRKPGYLRWMFVAVIPVLVLSLWWWQRDDHPPAEPLAQAEAYLNSQREDDWRTAVRELRAVLEHEPQRAEAYHLLALAKLKLQEKTGLGEASCAELLGLVDRALSLQPQAVESLILRANLLFWCRHSQADAEATYRQAMALAPDDARIPMQYAQLLLAQGRFAESLTQMELSRKLNPLHYSMPVVAWILQMQRRDDLALAEWQRITRAEPDNRYYHTSAQRIFASLGREAESFEHWLWLMRDAGFSQSRLDDVSLVFQHQGLAGVNHWLLEQRIEADLGHYIPPLSWARYALAAGELDIALDHLEEAAAIPQLPLLWAGVDPAYDAVRHTPRFQSLLVGLGVENTPLQHP